MCCPSFVFVDMTHRNNLLTPHSHSNDVENNNKELSQAEIRARSARLRRFKLHESTRRRNRHASLCEKDYVDSKSVDIDCIDSSQSSLARDFGNPGMLPEKYLAERAIKIHLRPRSVANFEFPLCEGNYGFALVLEPKGFFSFGKHKPLHAKVWSCNRSKGYSNVACSDCLIEKHSLLKFDFNIPSNDSWYLLLRLYSEARFSTAVVKCMFPLKSL